MGVDLYQVGVSGLMAAQQQLTTTGHNITNVNTQGYSRQRAEQISTSPVWTGNNWYGTGTRVNDVTRVFDRYAYREQLLAQTRYSYAETMTNKLSGLDSTLSRGGKIVQDSLQQFYGALNAVADKPSDIGLRQIMLDKADVLASQFNTLSSTLATQQSLVTEEIRQVGTRIGELGAEIADLNRRLISTPSVHGAPNDLLDQRDRLLTELGQYVSVSSYEHASGAISVYIGQGQTLVAETESFSTAVVPGDPDPLMTEIVLVNRGIHVKVDERSLGGQLGALYDYRDGHLKQSIAEIDLVAMGISQVMNDQQARGLDLNGLAGSPLFADINGSGMQGQRMLGMTANGGSLSGSIRIDDVGALSGTEYQLDYDGSDYILTDLATKTTTNLGPSGSGPFTTAAGFTFIETSGTPAPGDRWIINPTRNGSSNFSMDLNQANGIAASASVEVVANSNNVSSGVVEVSSVVDPMAARALSPMRLEVIEATPGVFTYTLFDGSNAVIDTAAYNPPEQEIAVPPAPAVAAFTLKVRGEPSGVAPFAPEKFEIRDAFGTGNGDNALQMSATQMNKLLKNAQFAFNEALTANVNLIGSQASAAESSFNSADVMLEQASARTSAISGVNLDEEAANLLRFQQAYQAAARVVTVAQTMFDTILQAAR